MGSFAVNTNTIALTNSSLPDSQTLSSLELFGHKYIVPEFHRVSLLIGRYLFSLPAAYQDHCPPITLCMRTTWPCTALLRKMCQCVADFKDLSMRCMVEHLNGAQQSFSCVCCQKLQSSSLLYFHLQYLNLNEANFQATSLRHWCQGFVNTMYPFLSFLGN